MRAVEWVVVRSSHSTAYRPKFHVPPSQVLHAAPSQVHRLDVPSAMSHRPKFHVPLSQVSCPTVPSSTSNRPSSPSERPECHVVGGRGAALVLFLRCCVLWDGWWCAPRSGVPALGWARGVVGSLVLFSRCCASGAVCCGMGGGALLGVGCRPLVPVHR